MIPYLLAVLGGYLIGDSIGEDIDKKLPQFADGGLSDQLEKVRGQRDSSVINPDELYRKLGEAERNWQKDGGEEYARVQRQIKENRKLYFKKLGEAEMNWHSDDGAEYTRLIEMRDKFADGGMMAKGGGIDKTKEAFGLLSFDDLESIFDVRLFGLGEEETEQELDSLKKEWDNMKSSERRVILKDFVPNWNKMM
jgi:hypothetical protein